MLTTEQMQFAFDAWNKAKSSVVLEGPFADVSGETAIRALYAVAKADIRTGGDKAAIIAALKAVQ